MAEWDAFSAKYCEVCEHDRVFRETGQAGCAILADAFCYTEHSDDYPQQWQYKDLVPVCTDFVITEQRAQPVRCDKTIDMFKVIEQPRRIKDNG
jgi:hypothetical protein